MARPLPIMLALICSFFSHCFAVYSSPHITGGAALLSTYVVRFALYFVLLNSSLYLKTLRKIHLVPEFIFQFVFGLFIIESAIVHIWYPLENALLCIIPICSKFLNNYVSKNGILYKILWYNVNVTQNNIVLLSASYFLSFLILCCIMHATRAVDFRLIRVLGIVVFFQDAFRRFINGFGKNISSRRGRGRRGKSRTRKSSRNRKRSCYS